MVVKGGLNRSGYKHFSKYLCVHQYKELYTDLEQFSVSK